MLLTQIWKVCLRTQPAADEHAQLPAIKVLREFVEDMRFLRQVTLATLNRAATYDCLVLILEIWVPAHVRSAARCHLRANVPPNRKHCLVYRTIIYLCPSKVYACRCFVNDLAQCLWAQVGGRDSQHLGASAETPDNFSIEADHILEQSHCMP